MCRLSATHFFTRRTLLIKHAVYHTNTAREFSHLEVFGVFVLLCFVDPILGNLTVRGHSLSQGTWGGRILTLHLNYVAGHTGPFLFLFERTHNYSVDNQGLLPWRLRRVDRSKVRSDSSVRCVPGSNRQTRGKPRSLTI